MKPSWKGKLWGVQSAGFKTKSGTGVYIVGGTPKQEEARAAPVVKYYNQNFTSDEQKNIGNVIYDLTYKIPSNATYDGQCQGLQNKRQMLNPGHKRVARFNINKDNVKNESSITHELIHVRRYMSGGSISRDERKVEYEESGRVSYNGYMRNLSENTARHLYVIPKYRRVLKTRQPQKVQKILPEVKRGMHHDRIRLTGSLKRSGKGDLFTKRVERTFPTSFIKRGRIIK